MADPEPFLISADSHVMEPPTLWVERLDKRFGHDAPRFPSGAGSFAQHPGGTDPVARLDEMAVDGVSAEVLYPTLALNLFHLQDAALQAACFRVYNDWLSGYCATDPSRLVGVAAISLYDPASAVAELERCRDQGLRGAVVWQLPPEELAFHTGHSEPFWAAAERLEMPVSLHILTGFDWSRRVSSDLLAGRSSTPEERAAKGEYGLRGVVNYKLCSAMTSLHDIVVSGVLERHPRLKVVLVETEIGWLPFALNQWDKYCARPSSMGQAISRLPSEYFDAQVYATFFNDPPGARQLAWWGDRNCMWSNDFPHPNSTWPHSRRVIERDLGGLDEEARQRLLWRTCAELYELDLVAVGAPGRGAR